MRTETTVKVIDNAGNVIRTTTTTVVDTPSPLPVTGIGMYL